MSHRCGGIMTQLEQNKDGFMKVVDGLLPVFIIFPVLFLFFPSSWYIADEMDLGFWPGALLLSLMTAAYLLPLAIGVVNYRHRRLEGWRQATKNECYVALLELETRGLRWAFRELEGGAACGTCHEQTVDLTVDKRYQPVPGAHEKHIPVDAGAYCPGCGQRAQERGNLFDGDLKNLLQELEKQNGIYFLQPPRDEAGIRKRIASLEERIERGEFALSCDKREHAHMRDMLAIEELKRSPAGYRIAAELPLVPVEPQPSPDASVDDDVEDVVEEEKRQYRPGLHCKIS